MAQKKSRWALVSVLAVLYLGFTPTMPVQGFEIFGLHLWGKKQRTLDETGREVLDTIGTPKTYQISLDTAGEENLAKIIAQASQLMLDKDRPASGSAGLIAKARSDYQRILAALYAQGYYGGTISITINGREAADFDLDGELGDESTIVIAMDSGAPYHFARADIKPVSPALPSHKRFPLFSNRPQTKPLPNFKIGEIARSDTILATEARAIEDWRAQGHPKARVANRRVIADHLTHNIEADIEIEPGPLASYGAVSVHNRSEKARLDSDYIAWMSGLKPGQIYHPQDIARAQKRLARLDVFRTHAIHEAEEIEADGALPLTLDVQERAPRRLGLGATYSTLDGAGFEGYWLHRNLFGRAERLRLEARIGGIGGDQRNSFHPENYSYRLGASFTRPGLLTPDTDFITNGRIEREVLENYTATGLYLQSGLAHIFRDEISGRLMVNIQTSRTSDDHFGRRNFTLAGLSGGLEFDNRDDKNNAKSGFYAQAQLEPVYEAGFGNFIVKSTLEGRAYHAIDEDKRFVLALRGRVGGLGGARSSEIPANMLFFAGGGGSVRGYGYRNIGIKTDKGTVIGGRSLIEASGEARVEVTETIGLVGFVDVGQVGADPMPDFSQPLKWGSGIGVRYKTGLGPVRLDVARPLEKEKGDPDLGIYIGIGQAF